VQSFVESVVGDDMHAKRVLSLANATLGVIHAASLAVSTIGRALAQARGLDPRHAVKQVDRLLSNTQLDVWELFASWVPMVLAERTEATVALDWTDYERDDHATLCAYLLTNHGRATPLVWRTAQKSELGGLRNDIEDLVFNRLKEVVPAGVKVTVLADRGFGDTALYALLRDLGFDFVVRFRGNIIVAAEGAAIEARDWLSKSGRAKRQVRPLLTRDAFEVPAVVVVHAKGMAEPWFLATSLDAAAGDVIKAYARRFTIEESFRDAKDWRFGMGLAAAHVGEPRRRDRLLLVSAMAVALLTLLGAAAEACGLDKTLRVNTVKRRTHSLFTQGVYFYGALPMMKPHRLEPLMAAFGELVRGQPFFREVFAVL